MAESWEALAEAGKAGQALAALAALKSTRALLPEEIIVECELLDSTSSSDHGLERAKSLLRRRDLPKAVSARALAVIGSQHLRMSRVSAGRAAFEEATKAAQ